MNPSSIHPRIEAARAGVDPALICKVPSGWVFLCALQFLRGYCILQADPVVESINVLGDSQRVQFLEDMVRIGDAVLEVTGAYRVNYFIAGNSDPVLHAHIVPRYLTEPEEMRKGLPWAYPNAEDQSTRFDAERDHSLMVELSRAILKRF
jgi:diadenosine tetraphosphate (Ap4A) HIT family hydrolase